MEIQILYTQSLQRNCGIINVLQMHRSCNQMIECYTPTKLCLRPTVSSQVVKSLTIHSFNFKKEIMSISRMDLYCSKLRKNKIKVKDMLQDPYLTSFMKEKKSSIRLDVLCSVTHVWHQELYHLNCLITVYLAQGLTLLDDSKAI